MRTERKHVVRALTVSMSITKLKTVRADGLSHDTQSLAEFRDCSFLIVNHTVLLSNGSQLTIAVHKCVADVPQ